MDRSTFIASRNVIPNLILPCVWVVFTLLLFGCAEQNKNDAKVSLFAVPGQITLSNPPLSSSSFYAASRFLEQSTFGPNEREVEAVQKIGMEAWINSQLALPPTKLDPTPLCCIPDTSNVDRYTEKLLGSYNLKSTEIFVVGEDQLRLRVNWVLSNFLVVSNNKLFNYPLMIYFNMLQEHGMGNLEVLLKKLILSPVMNNFLDNDQNVNPKACEQCFGNENFARELLQLFTIGVFELSSDGRLKRDSRGLPIESYTQQDVQNLTLALSGWMPYEYVPRVSEIAGIASNPWRYEMPMRSKGGNLHSSDEKIILGTKIPAGQTAEGDVDSVVKILFNHKNIGPFWVSRLIQGLVTSDPSPEYVARVVSVFENNGKGVRGDLGAVVKAILLDQEARRADNPQFVEKQVGRIREPLLYSTGLMRALDCKKALTSITDPEWGLFSWQASLNAPSVFGYISPTYRAPQSGTLAPEQQLLDGQEFSNRFGVLASQYAGWNTNRADLKEGGIFRLAGCGIDTFVSAYSKSNKDFADLVSRRFFRGAMPVTLYQASSVLRQESARYSNWSDGTKMATNLAFLLSTPNFGAIE